MKSKNNLPLKTIKKNDDFVLILKSGKKIKNETFNIWIKKNNLDSYINYGLIVAKTHFKKAVARNRIKRQLRSMLQKINFTSNISILIRPNENFIKNKYQENLNRLQDLIIRN